MGCSSAKHAGVAVPGENDRLPQRSVKAGGFSRSQLIVDNPGRIQQSYELDKTHLGRGSYGHVYRATRKNQPGSNPLAVKAVEKAKLVATEHLNTEIGIMKVLDHPNIVRLHESFADDRYIYLVLELCTGGELFERIVHYKHFGEKQSATVMQQLFRAVHYMHKSHICHRDIKPENILFEKAIPVELNQIKVADFGLACYCAEGQVLTKKAGTPYYVSPQVLRRSYDQSCDVWSCGVIMYMLLCGYAPFQGETEMDTCHKVLRGTYQFHRDAWKGVSQDAKNLIDVLLSYNPKDRPCARKALGAGWVKSNAPKAKQSNLNEGLIGNVQEFQSSHVLKKAAVHVIAGRLSETHTKLLRETFTSLDVNHDGRLTAAEMRRGLRTAGLEEVAGDLQRMINEVDADGSGSIDYTDFLAATVDPNTYKRDAAATKGAFDVFDRDGDGKISLDELKLVLGDGSRGANITELLQQVDTDGDNSVSYAEFMQMMHGTKGGAREDASIKVLLGRRHASGGGTTK